MERAERSGAALWEQSRMLLLSKQKFHRDRSNLQGQRICFLFPQSLSTATGVFPATSDYFLSPPSPLYDARRVEKLRHHAPEELKGLFTLIAPPAHTHGWSLAPWAKSPTHCIWEGARINAAPGNAYHWSCTQGKKMYSPLEGSEGRRRNQEEGTVLSTFSPAPCGSFHTELTPPIFDFV